MSVAVDIRSVAKIFGAGPDAVHAFGPADLAVEAGEFVSLLGPSGCGKSTLMLMIAGLLPLSQGEIRMNGETVAAPQTDIGIMFQDNTLVPWRTSRQHRPAARVARAGSPRRIAGRVDELLRQVQLEDFAYRYPHELSGGMQQRAAFCQALVHDPQTVLLDEPLGKLDAMTRESIRTDLQALWMQKRPTVVFVTHSDRGGGAAVEPGLRDHAAARPHRPDHRRSTCPGRATSRSRAARPSSAMSASIQEIFHGYGVL